MYSDTMARTQVYLGAVELDLLDRAGRITGASRSELIRRAIRSAFGEGNQAERLEALRASAGSWRDRNLSGAEYVESIRGLDGLNERLEKLGLD